jgi:hypothetical protein
MARRAYPDFEPAWVEDKDKPGTWALFWLDETGKPSEPIGVARECDVPGIHTPGAVKKIFAMSVSAQHDRMWPSAPSAVEVEPIDEPKD